MTNAERPATSVAVALACALACTGACAGEAPRLLGDRDLATVWGQGLAPSTVEALAAGSAARLAGQGDGGAFGLAGSGGSGNDDTSRAVERRFAQAQADAAMTGLRQGIALARNLSIIATVPAALPVALPVISLPFFFGLPVGLPPAPPSKTDKGPH